MLTAYAAAAGDDYVAAPDEGADKDLGQLLGRAAGLALMDFHENLRERGVSGTEWRALSVLAEQPGQTVGLLATRCLMQQPTMTKLLEGLGRAGHVRREYDTRDRRVVRMYLNPQGEELVEGLSQEARRHEQRLLAHLPAEDARDLKAALRRLIALIEPRRPR